MDGIIERYLERSERGIGSRENNPTYVYEKNTTNSIALNVFLKENSKEILDKIYSEGAVLLRGFDILNESDFEDAIKSIKGMAVMDDYFMAEPGRVLVENCKHVFHTNKNINTGGALYLGGFHNENYYSTDVPQFISFWCREPSAYGGETGLVNMTSVFQDLSISVKRKLSAKTFLADSHSLQHIAKRYNISVEQIIAECNAVGLEINIDSKEQKILSIYKPTVIIHPVSGKTALISNLSSEIPALDKLLLKEFKKAYKEPFWAYHKFIWRYLPIIAMVSQIKLKTLINSIPNLFKAIFRENEKRPGREFLKTDKRIGSVFEDTDVKSLAKSMKLHFSSFTWKRGDILLIDNLQMAHTGMPGSGSRIIRAILCNPIAVQATSSSSGVQTPKIGCDALASRLKKL